MVVNFTYYLNAALERGCELDLLLCLMNLLRCIVIKKTLRNIINLEEKFQVLLCCPNEFFFLSFSSIDDIESEDTR